MINTFPNSKPKGASAASMLGLPARDVNALGPFNPLSWWQHQTLQIPLLADIASKIFVIPASSAECERHFSAFNAHNIITAQRNAINSEIVQAISVVLEGYKTGVGTVGSRVTNMSGHRSPSQRVTRVITATRKI